MTVRENIGYGLKITSDLSTAEIRDRVEETAELLEIPELLDKKPKELSGGQQQRVALGRAIIRDPEVFLMDEPLSNLDAKLRTQMRTEIQQLQQDLATTTIYVTHDQTEAMTMGDRIAVLNDGELQQVGTPLDCYHSPTNQFVAGFIGSPSMNFLAVDDAGGTLEHPEFSYDLSESVRGHLADAPDALTLGVRPEHITLADADADNAVAAHVAVVEPMGSVSHVYLELGDSTYTASLPGDVAVEAGDDLHVTFPEEKVHLFDRTTGDAIKHSDAAAESAAVDATPADD
jgi:multiple sugar transport system ATP-binding protein